MNNKFIKLKDKFIKVRKLIYKVVDKQLDF